MLADTFVPSVCLPLCAVLARTSDELFMPELVRGMTLCFQNYFSEKVTIKSGDTHDQMASRWLGGVARIRMLTVLAL
jgi:hypothetical protein